LILDKIRADYLMHRKARDTVAVALLSTLIGEIQTKEKVSGTMDDPAVVAVIKKFIDGVNESVEHSGASPTTIRELAILNDYMPKQLTVAEIQEILALVGITDQGPAQKHMKQHYAGLYNGKDVNTALIPNKD
jgi:uncharacterized protein YqeY